MVLFFAALLDFFKKPVIFLRGSQLFISLFFVEGIVLDKVRFNFFWCDGSATVDKRDTCHFIAQCHKTFIPSISHENILASQLESHQDTVTKHKHALQKRHRHKKHKHALQKRMCTRVGP